MDVKSIFQATVPGGAQHEGLAVTIVDQERVVVAVTLARRTQSVSLDRSGAARLAEALAHALEGERWAA